jgi:hypothetical protein
VGTHRSCQCLVEMPQTVGLQDPFGRMRDWMSVQGFNLLLLANVIADSLSLSRNTDCGSAPDPLVQIGWALPEYGAVWSRNIDVAEPPRGAVALKADVALPAKVVGVSEEWLAVDLDADATPA